MYASFIVNTSTRKCYLFSMRDPSSCIHACFSRISTDKLCKDSESLRYCRRVLCELSSQRCALTGSRRPALLAYKLRWLSPTYVSRRLADFSPCWRVERGAKTSRSMSRAAGQKNHIDLFPLCLAVAQSFIGNKGTATLPVRGRYTEAEPRVRQASKEGKPLDFEEI